MEVSPEHVLITCGSQQALDLAARAFLDPGDEVIIESPSYLAAIQTFDSYEARYCTLRVDEEGMDPDGLKAALARKPRLVYTLPNFQNPTGITLSGERRQRLAEAAAESGVGVLEDDAYHELRYEGQPLAPVYTLAPNPRSVYTGTFSKTIAPGLRVGYVCADPEVIVRLGQLKQITDLHSGSLTQRVVYEYCTRGCHELSIRVFREAYRSRRDAMLQALEEHCAGLFRWTRPEGGMFVFATLPEDRDAGELLRRAMAWGVVFVPGATFHPDGAGANTFRLNFVSAGEEQIREGVRILAEVIREQHA
jgi:2-aminoadipate transaminase